MSDQMHDSGRAPREVTFNRRQLYGVLTASLFGGGAAVNAFTDIPERLERQGLLSRIVSEVGQNRRHAVATLIETLAVWAGAMVVCDQMNQRGIAHGTYAGEGEAAAQFALHHPFLDYLHPNVSMPLFEEFVFRLLPSALFAEEQPPNVKLHWVTGLSANAAFALMHNFSNPEPGKFSFKLDSLPLEQYILGAYCWYVQRRGGFMHAVGAHMLYNHLCSAYEWRGKLTESDDARDA
jgi:hypothetical protein